MDDPSSTCITRSSHHSPPRRRRQACSRNSSQLLQSPLFHDGVRKVHKTVHRVRHGKDPAEMGGTNIDHVGESRPQRFLKFYIEELKDQIRGTTKK
ncbi:hypothetical protein PVAG01_03088 [Phlyctema vagabunda]|uniref:Uncharacterized protein n=1 Tax=Phlyctema vagabunda TaxID=108571 RepID=A0ABR4PSG5_9HELO